MSIRDVHQVADNRFHRRRTAKLRTNNCSTRQCITGLPHLFDERVPECGPHLRVGLQRLPVGEAARGGHRHQLLLVVTLDVGKVGQPHLRAQARAAVRRLRAARTPLDPAAISNASRRQASTCRAKRQGHNSSKRGAHPSAPLCRAWLMIMAMMPGCTAAVLASSAAGPCLTM